MLNWPPIKTVSTPHLVVLSISPAISVIVSLLICLNWRHHFTFKLEKNILGCSFFLFQSTLHLEVILEFNSNHLILPIRKLKTRKARWIVQIHIINGGSHFKLHFLYISTMCHCHLNISCKYNLAS